MTRSRPTALATALALLVAVAAGCAAPDRTPVAAPPTTVPDLPTRPVALRILDVSGVLALTKPIIENFAREHPQLVSSVRYESGTPTDVVGKLYAQQQSGNVTDDLVLTGTEGLSLLTKQQTVVPLLPGYATALPDPAAVMTQAARQLQTALDGTGMIISGQPDGPVLAYDTRTVAHPPKTPQELLAWAKAHPGRFGYAAVPTGSGPANQFTDALPHMLGDTNPADPATWTRTWAYLAELNRYTAPYATKTVDTFDALARGSLDIVLTETGFDVQMRAKGVLGDQFALQAFDDPVTIEVAQWAAVPRGVAPDRLAVCLALIKYLLQPRQQALTIPFRAAFPVQGVELSMASADARARYQRFGSPDFNERLLATAQVQNPVVGDHVQVKYDIWNRSIGAKR
ncbi:putative spermidine/putrescine transport system substrate-binding protein [Micromonospora haikouensis]|uniref:Putative spermidine/putrescine transport system substrate-binding protein n=1 Tax=Micromonospora haikouensis TaxID=686309 RepID=A0A1C4WVW6_9ACTN|nr:extracellular solute-binding protein [Micromonospora haikouensis]SCF00397.1 putative spermidine/putrescine transport system substrate-binding protein [Micromonospora haikouensis]